MIWRILKTLLHAVNVQVHYREGDMVFVKIMWNGKVVFERNIDIMPGV